MNKQIISAIAPGRINIIGEHTDYNDGFVFPAAIDRFTRFDIQKHELTDTIEIDCISNGEKHISLLSELSPVPENSWVNYLLGVISELIKAGHKLGGIKASFNGNIPIGSGLSSSAALECSFAIGLKALFQLEISDWELIKCAQMAEHHYVGTKCGIMDQFASVKGKKDTGLLLDCKSLEFEHIPLNTGDYQFVLIDSNVKHSLAESQYNLRREECESALFKISDINSYRELKPSALQSIKNLLTPTEYKRVHHIITENQRVHMAKNAMINKNISALGKLIYQSHQSLSDDYEVSCDELDYLVAYSQDHDYVLGSRMMGGGFGGCTLNLIKKDHIQNYTDQILTAYHKEYGIEAEVHEFNIARGAHLISNT